MRNLEECQLPKDNMKKEHQKVFKRSSGVWTANKGNATMVMKRSDYDRRMRGMLHNTTYL